MFRQYLDNMIEKWATTPEINYSIQYLVIMIPPPYIVCISLNHKLEATQLLNVLSYILYE